MEIPISVLFSNANPCFLAFNQCCVINLKSPYSLGFVGKKEHFVFPCCFLTSQCFWAPEVRLQMIAEEISKRLTVCLLEAVLYRIVPPISPASHCFFKWHLSGICPGFGSFFLHYTVLRPKPAKLLT